MSNLIIAFIGTLGVLITASAFTPLIARLTRGRRPDLGDVDEIDPALRLLKEERLALFANRPLLERLFARPVQSGTRTLLNLGVSSPDEARQRADKVARDLRKSGYRYPTVGDFYANKILGAVLFFFMGLVAIILMDMPNLFFLPLALGLLGLFIPDREVKSAIKKRKVQKWLTSLQLVPPAGQHWRDEFNTIVRTIIAHRVDYRENSYAVHRKASR